MDHKVRVKRPKSHLRFEHPLVIKQFSINGIGRSTIIGPLKGFLWTLIIQLLNNALLILFDSYT